MWLVLNSYLFNRSNFFSCKDLDKNYNDKLCLEYELNVTPVHLTTTDECILAALRKLSSLEQQVIEKEFLIERENECGEFRLHNQFERIKVIYLNIKIDKKKKKFFLNHQKILINN